MATTANTAGAALGLTPMTTDAAVDAASPVATTARPQPAAIHPISPSSPLEMSELNSPASFHSAAQDLRTPLDAHTPPISASAPVSDPATQAAPRSSTPAPAIDTAHAPEHMSFPPRNEQEEREAEDSPIQPAIERMPTTASLPVDPRSAVSFVLLLPSTGTRHQFIIDKRYLRRRGVGSVARSDSVSLASNKEAPLADSLSASDIDPWAISIYQVKELIWRDWRSEWETRPSNAAAIRLIHLGRLLDDKSILKGESPLTASDRVTYGVLTWSVDCRLTAGATNVVHMSIKPQNLDDEDAAADKVRRSNSRRSGVTNDDGQVTRSGCSCCLVS